MSDIYSEPKNNTYTYKISVCIPTYEMNGSGKSFLKHSLDILAKQTYKNFEIVISDNSPTDIIKNLCDEYKELNINYFKNPIRGMSANTNSSIRNARGQIIKILFQDDFLFNEKSLEQIVDNFDIEKDKWMVTACDCTRDGINFFKPHYPKYHDKIHISKNTIGSPSVLSIKNEDILFFDEKLLWAMDTDYYKRCYEKFGKPKILNVINVANRIGPHQTSSTNINNTLIDVEYKYLLKKFKENNYIKLMLFRKLKRLTEKMKKYIKEKI